jgi:hypothetical protein
MDEPRIRRRVREMITTGELPCEDPAELWASHGDGKRCAACAEPIGVREIEYEVTLTSGSVILMHRPCRQIWLEECAPGASTPPTEAPLTP